MIIDHISKLYHYSCINHAFADIDKIIKSICLDTLSPGKHTIPRSEVYYFYFEYGTKPLAQCNGEIHSRMIDVHFIITGSEKIGVCNRTAAKLSPYDVENDCSVVEAEFDYYTISEGSFTIFLPHEAHITAINAGNLPILVKKLVFKVPL